MMKNYENMTVTELKEVLKGLGVENLSGNKAVLLAKITEAEKNVTGETMDKEEVEVSAPTYAVNAMRNAIAKAHILNNRKAINRDEAFMAGATEERFNQWVVWVDNLRDVVSEYVRIKHVKSTSQKELDLARGRIFPAWRTILKVGEEDIFHPNMFVRESDVDSLVGYCETFMSTTKGTQLTTTTKVIFRKQVEALLGCRMAGNAVLVDQDRDDLSEFYKAEKSLASANKRLAGYTNNEGKYMPGINDKLKAAKKSKAEAVEMLASMGMSDEDIKVNKFVVNYDNMISDLETQKKAAEGVIKTATNTINEKRDRVGQIEDMLNEIEGVTIK